MGTFLFKAGLWILLAAVALAILANMAPTQFGETGPTLAKTALAVGGGVTALGALIWLLTRGVSAVSQRRCVRCGRRVARGATYCPDHLKESVEQARDKIHKYRGSGV